MIEKVSTAKKFLLLLALSLNTLSAAPMKPPKKFYKDFVRVDHHPGFDPLMSHIDFRKLADFTIDQGTDFFDPDWVKQGDIVYVNIWLLPWFDKYVHDQIKSPYILISCDVAGRVPEKPGKLNNLLYDPKCAAWFCRNILFSYHPKLQQIPWGQDLWVWNSNPNAIEPLKQAIRQKPFEKKHLLYMNHTPRSFGDRDKIVKLFENAPYCFSRNIGTQTCQQYTQLSHAQYYDELGSSVFVISPLGLETDCVRTWEAFALETIPIVEHTFLDPQYEGMPILIVHDWEEINENYLKTQYEQIQSKNLSTEKAYINYWRDLIRERQQKIKNNELETSFLEASKFDPDELRQLSELMQNRSTNCSGLLYRGVLTTLRPFQLATAIGPKCKILLYDPWLDQETAKSLKKYAIDPSLFKDRSKILLLSSDAQFNRAIDASPHAPVFLDLTYYRNGLLRTTASYRHSLRKDILSLYDRMHKGTLLCGNMGHDDYVKKVLDILAKKDGLGIQQENNLWSLKKE